NFKDDDFPVVELVGDAHEADSEALSREEIDAVGVSLVFDAVLGKGYVRWGLIFGFAGLTAALLAAGFWASTLTVTDTLVLYSQDRWVPGQDQAVRLAYIDDEEGFIPLKTASLTLLRNQAPQEAVLFSGSLQPGQAASVVINPPRWEEGDYNLEVRAETLRNKKKAALDITLDPAFSGSDYLLSETAETLSRSTGTLSHYDPERDIRIELIPESNIVASSLHNIVYMRTTRGSGEPLSARVGLKLARGYINGSIPASVQTDAAGLGTFMVYPSFNVLAIGVAAADGLEPPAAGADGRGEIDLPVQPRIFRVRSQTPNLQPGREFTLRVYTISKASPFYLDIYRGGLWSYALSGFLNSFSTEITLHAPNQPGLIAVQGYGAPALVGNANSSIHLWVQKEGETLRKSIASIAGILMGRGIDMSFASRIKKSEGLIEGCNEGQLLAFLLSRLDTGFYEPVVYYTTRKDDEKKVALLKEKLKRIVVMSLSCGMAIFLLAVVFALLHAFRRRPALVQELQEKEPMDGPMEEIEDWKGRRVQVASIPPLSELESRQTLLHTGWGKESGMGTRRFYIQIAMLAAVTASLFGLLAMFITYMRWSFDL
ncbi:MAG: hypothetical protein ABIJ56_10905, partial [Pseudomonadota bacterium]